MATAKKYLFDISFDQAASKPVVVPEPEPEETFSRAELEAAQQAARADGHGAGLAEANDAATARAAGAIETLAKGVTTLLAARDATALETERQAIAALRVIVAKTLPVLAAKGALAEIEALATKCLIEAVDEPRVVLRVANDVYEPVRGQLDAMAAASGYAGRIVLLADEMLVAGDARVEWADGGVERNLAQQLNEIDATLARSCDPAATPNPPSPSGDEL
jgi:flagellar assembly protein FliH